MAGGRERVERRLAAIFAADVAAYSRLMSQDEIGTLRTLTARREVMDRLITEHGGRIANTAETALRPSLNADMNPDFARRSALEPIERTCRSKACP